MRPKIRIVITAIIVILGGWAMWMGNSPWVVISVVAFICSQSVMGMYNYAEREAVRALILDESLTCSSWEGMALGIKLANGDTYWRNFKIEGRQAFDYNYGPLDQGR